MSSDHQEVDAIDNPTQLFQRINSGDWDGALLTLHRAQAEASIWISRWSKRNHKIAWKYLPLHLVCLQQKPPLSLLKALLQANPHAASAPTQHDGNLPIHYVCESGCDDANVLTALIAAFPKCMTVMNGNNKTPMMICSPRSRSLLKKVLKQILPSEQPKFRMESPRSDYKESRVDQRNASNFSSRDTVSTAHHEHRQSPDNTTNHYSSPPFLQRELSEHGPMNNFDFTYSLSSDTESCSSPSPPCNNDFKTTQTPTGKKHATPQNLNSQDSQSTTSILSAKLQKISFSSESSDMKLCDRILAKAESDSVKLRAQIQQLQTQKNKLEEEAKLKESSMDDNLKTLVTALKEQGGRSNIILFDQKDESSNPDLACITDAVLKLLSHMEMKSAEAKEQVTSLHSQLSETNVKHKSALATNLALQKEKQIIKDERDNLETMLSTLESEKESLKKELRHEKETTNSLRVINQSLQEQIDTDIGGLPMHESNLRSQVRCLNADLQKMKDEQKNSDESQKYQQQISSLLEEQKSLRERNQMLKETIRENSEVYSRKIMELEKKFEEIEQSNQKFRRNNESKEES